MKYATQNNNSAVTSFNGVYMDLTGAAYHAQEAMSASGAKKILRSPAHYRMMRENASKPTAAMQFGTAVHTAILEPDRSAYGVLRAPTINLRTNDGRSEWKDFLADNPDSIILSEDDYARYERCVSAVRRNPAAMELLQGAQTEVSLFWRDGRRDVPCKARLDAINHGGIIDLKTCQDASPDAFGKAAANLLYHIQASHYSSGYEATIEDYPEFFAFICVESDEPHGVACYVLDSLAIEAGSRLMDLALERYASALNSGQWKSYPDTIQTLSLPYYATRIASDY